MCYSCSYPHIIGVQPYAAYLWCYTTHYVLYTNCIKFHSGFLCELAFQSIRNWENCSRWILCARLFHPLTSQRRSLNIYISKKNQFFFINRWCQALLDKSDIEKFVNQFFKLLLVSSSFSLFDVFEYFLKWKHWAIKCFRRTWATEAKKYLSKTQVFFVKFD